VFLDLDLLSFPLEGIGTWLGFFTFPAEGDLAAGFFLKAESMASVWASLKSFS